VRGELVRALGVAPLGFEPEDRRLPGIGVGPPIAVAAASYAFVGLVAAAS
jgi:hypothetical protein